MKHFSFGLMMAVLVSGCNETTEVLGDDAFPNPFVIVGEADAGSKEMVDILKHGEVHPQPDFAGRVEGITVFCSGHAHGLALGEKMSAAEEKTCRDLGGRWQGYPTQRGTFVYLTPAIAKLLMAKPDSHQP